jgi:hypothetical protein
LLKSIRRLLQGRDGEEEFDWQEKNRKFTALLNSRKIDEALALGQTLMDYVDRKYRTDAREKATTYNNMGMAFLLSREYSLAEQCLRTALDMRKRLLGENHNEVAVILLNLVELYKVQAREILTFNRVETRE